MYWFVWFLCVCCRVPGVSVRPVPLSEQPLHWRGLRLWRQQGLPGRIRWDRLSHEVPWRATLSSQQVPVRQHGLSLVTTGRRNIWWHGVVLNLWQKVAIKVECLYNTIRGGFKLEIWQTGCQFNLAHNLKNRNVVIEMKWKKLKKKYGCVKKT